MMAFDIRSITIKFVAEEAVRWHAKSRLTSSCVRLLVVAIALVLDQRTCLKVDCHPCRARDEGQQPRVKKCSTNW